jgi:hypothetical protein
MAGLPLSDGLHSKAMNPPARPAAAGRCPALLLVVGMAAALALLAGLAFAPHLLGGGRLTVRFREQLPPMAGLGGVYFQHPSVFKRRIASLYLASDIDPVTQNNLGLPGCNTPTVFFSPDCDASHDCDIEGAAPSHTGRRTRHLLRSWFDFLRPAEEMDAELNNHEATLCPGAYRYVRIEWSKRAGETVAGCDGYDGRRMQPGDDAIRQPCPFTHMWQGGGMTQPYYSTGGGSTTTIKLNNPVEVSWGSHRHIEVELQFSLMDTIVQNPAECQRSHNDVVDDADEEDHRSCLCATDAADTRSHTKGELAQVSGRVGPCLRLPLFHARVVSNDDDGL